MGPESLFDTWLAPLDVAAFRDEFFSKRPLFRGPSAARLATLEGLLPWNALDILAARTRDVTAWFEAKDGRHLTADVSPAAASKLYQAGTTFYLKETPELAPVADAVADAMLMPKGNFQCNLFCNPPGARTRAHFDPVDTITIQVRGSKRWRIAPNRHAPDPNMGWATLDRTMRPELRFYLDDALPQSMPAEGAEEYALEPGAVLYVPRGYWHETRSDEESISIHVHHVPLPWIDAVLVALRSKLVRDPGWRASASTLWDPTRRDADEATLKALLRSLAGAVADLAPDDVLPTPRPRRGAAEAGEPFSRRAMTSFVVESEGAAGGAWSVSLSAIEQGTERRTTVEMSEPHVRACRLFAGPTPPALSARDLAARAPGLSLGEALGLVNLLLDVGFLRPALLTQSVGDPPLSRRQTWQTRRA